MADLKDLVYSISYEINESGLNKTTKTETDIDKSFKDIASSVDKVDSNLDKMAASAQRASKSTKIIGTELDGASSKAQKASNSTKNIGTELDKVSSKAKNAGNSTKTIADNLDKAENKAKSVSKHLGSMHGGAHGGMDTMSALGMASGSLSGPGIGIGIGAGIGVGAGLKGAISTYADFEQQMASVHATLGKVLDGDMPKLENRSIELSNKWGIASKEVAGAEESLASAGFDVKEILDATEPTVLLATAGHIDLAVAADDTSGAIRSFGLTTKDSAHVVDVYAKAAADTNAQMGDMAEAMKYAAQPAHAAGMSIEETASAIGIMANNSIKGSMAGTTLRSMLASLGKPSKEASELMQATGFSAYDSQEKMKTLSDVIENLRTSTSKMTDQEKQYYLTTLFGQESMSGMLALVSTGPNELDKLTESFKKSDGAAKDMAETQNNTLSGSFRILKTNIENTADAVVKNTGLGQLIRDIADSITQHGPQIENEVMYIGGVVKDFIGFVKDNGPTIAPIIGGVAAAFVTLSTTLSIANGVMGILALVGLGPLGIAILAVAATVGVAVGAFIYWKTHSDQIKYSLDLLWISIKTGAESAINFMIDKIDAGISKLNGLIGIANKLPGVNIPLVDSIDHVNLTGEKRTATRMGGSSEYAAGTQNAVGGLALVGEYGPEIVNLPKASQVIPNNSTQDFIKSQSQVYGSSSMVSSPAANVKVESSPTFQLTIVESKDAKATSIEVERVLREKFGAYADKLFETLAIQMGYVPIQQT